MVALCVLPVWRPQVRALAAIAALVIGGAGVVMSGARGAMLSWLASCWALGAASGGRRRALIACVGTAALAIGGALAFRALDLQRFEAALNGQDGRTYIWAAAVAIIREHPLTGVGDGAYNDAATDVVNRDLAPRNPVETERMGNPHNSYLSLLVLHGIPGLVLWCGWLGTIVVHLWRRRHAHPAVWPLTMGTLAVMLVGGLTEDLAAYTSSRFQLCFGLALALGLAHRATASAPYPSDCPILSVSALPRPQLGYGQMSAPGVGGR
jgi:O-antigen ligase